MQLMITLKLFVNFIMLDANFGRKWKLWKTQKRSPKKAKNRHRGKLPTKREG